MPSETTHLNPQRFPYHWWRWAFEVDREVAWDYWWISHYWLMRLVGLASGLDK